MRNILEEKEYKFVHETDNILIGYGGSISYGTSREDSDIDIRGVYKTTVVDNITGNYKEQVDHRSTDTVLYSINKAIKLLAECNPNMIEMLGLKPEHYIYLNTDGEFLLANRKEFLSRQAIYTFGGYANSQLRRLENKFSREMTQDKKEAFILKSMDSVIREIRDEINMKGNHPFNSLILEIADSNNPDRLKEIVMNCELHQYPLRDFLTSYNKLHSIVKSYEKLGDRNTKAITHGKLGKHMSHLFRLYYMAFDILLEQEIITYREKEHDLLMDLRNGEYLDKDGVPIDAFYKLLHELEVKFDEAKEKTLLPDRPNKGVIDGILTCIVLGPDNINNIDMDPCF